MKFQYDFSLRFLIGLMSLAAVAVSVSMYFYRYESQVLKTRSSPCRVNLINLSAAISNYELVNGQLPPSCIFDVSGNPAHSWRVLLLPYLEKGELYRRYDFSKPWNHPNNLKIADEGGKIFCSCTTTKLRKNHTTYVAVDRDNSPWGKPNANWPEEKGRVLVIESLGDQTHWMSPSDFSSESAVIGIHGAESNWVFVAFTSGSVERIDVSDLKERIKTKGAGCAGIKPD